MQKNEYKLGNTFLYSARIQTFSKNRKVRRISVSVRDGKSILVHSRKLLIEIGKKEVDKLHGFSNSFALKVLLSYQGLDVQAYMFSTSLLLVGCIIALFLHL